MGATEPEPGRAVAARIAEAVEDRSATGIAGAVNQLVRAGELPIGTRLPTVRGLAGALGTSPTTVNEAWRSLIRVGAIRTEGRNGSFVAEQPHIGQPARFWRIAGAAGRFTRDLSACVPDPELLPPLHSVLAGIGHGPRTSGYLDPPVLPELESVLRDSWRELWRPETVTVVNGALDALDRLLTWLVRLGDRVLVENPTFAPFLDLLELLGAKAIPVAIDEEGMRPDELAAALRDQGGPSPAVLLLQPRAHNPAGASMTPARAMELADTLHSAPSTVVIEDDHAGAVSIAEPVTLARYLPDRTVYVGSFSKSHGPDLRLAAIAGPARIVDDLIARRNLGPTWSSRLLQRVLVELLTDADCIATVARARSVYSARRTALADALAARGAEVVGRDGFNLWLTVQHERDALVVLAAHGIGAAPGTPFLVEPLGREHLRVTTSLLRTDAAADVAEVLAHAARPARHGPNR